MFSKKQNENDKLRVRMLKILDILEKEYPEARIQLHYSTPFELLVATILSAQCTDERVNKVTSVLFQNYNTPEDFINIKTEDLEREIFSTGFYKAKSKHIKQAAETVIEKFNGQIPSTMEELLTIPGVGRKTANVILGHCFDQPAIVVDTHVIRLSNRLGFVNTKNPVQIEFQLKEFIPIDKWVIFTHYIIQHGRKTCSSRSPKCSKCKISQSCKFFFDTKH